MRLMMRLMVPDKTTILYKGKKQRYQQASTTCSVQGIRKYESYLALINMKLVGILIGLLLTFHVISSVPVDTEVKKGTAN